MDFVPVPYVGIIEVYLRSDYRYGPVDPIQWPQVYCEAYQYLSAVSRPVLKHLGYVRRSSVSLLEQLVDEILQEAGSVSDGMRGKLGTGEDVGEYIASSIGHLPWMCKTLQHGRARITQYPTTFRDAFAQIRELQRFCLMARAFLDFRQLERQPPSNDGILPVNPTLMGAFTTNPRVVQKLYDLGIPVWFIRPRMSLREETVVRAVAPLIEPNNVCIDGGPFGDVLLYTGLSGPAHIAITHRELMYLDFSNSPLSRRGGPSRPQNGSSRAHDGPSRPQNGSNHSIQPTVHPSQARGVNKFIDPDHEWIPKVLAGWAEAMSTVDLSQPARPNFKIWGYWTPEPAMLLRPKTTDRRDRYILTWLRMRDAWLYVLRDHGRRPTSVPTQFWRDVLYGPTGRERTAIVTKNAARWQSVLNVFGDVFHENNLDVAPVGPIRWFQYSITHPTADIIPKVVWELYDLGFRYEILALDTLLAPTDSHSSRIDYLRPMFPDDSFYSLLSLPEQPVGLYHPVPRGRITQLEAFRRVLLRWPRCPRWLRSCPLTISMTEDQILTVEKEMTRFYVDTFFEQSGRAPIVPHQIPVTMTCV
ncbi:hypothetical protein C8Q80DRAFT_1222075 [Daedaleopsis nitida]|nr:hypothetical protein C8Q80DRAFT_1222075 [Daedaleopsis nitida]